MLWMVTREMQDAVERERMLSPCIPLATSQAASLRASVQVVLALANGMELPCNINYYALLEAFITKNFSEHSKCLNALSSGGPVFIRLILKLTRLSGLLSGQ